MIWGAVLIVLGLLLQRLYYNYKKVDLPSFFKGKVVWITGASSGIGKELALQLHSLGAHTILSSRKKEALEKVKAECEAISKFPESQCHVVPLDLAEVGCDEKVAADVVNSAWNACSSLERKGIDIVINNGGISMRGSIEDTVMDVHRKLMNVNYFGTIALIKELLPFMTGRSVTSCTEKKGHIVAVSSVQGKLGMPLRAAYSASKHALQGYFDTLRVECMEMQIDTTLVCPGYVQTSLSKNAMAGSGGQWGKMDNTTASGMTTDSCVSSILQAIAKKQTEALICDFKAKAAVFARYLVPGLLSKALFRRMMKEKKRNAKGQ